MFLLLLYVGGALATSFLCSILEAAVLSTRVVELSQRKDHGDKSAELLLDLKQNRLDDAISAILLLNTVAHTVGAALAGAQAAVVFGDSMVGVFSGVLTVLVLVFTEIIPKTLGTTYASQLVGFVARVTDFMTKMLKPALAITSLMTKLITRGTQHRPAISRGELAAMINLAAREGTLHDEHSRMATNVLRYDEVKVEDVMTPRTVVAMLPTETTIAAFLADEATRVFSRIPLFEGSRDEVVGYVLQREVLSAAAKGTRPETPLAEFQRKALFIPEGQRAGRVLRRLTEEREHMALVTDEYGGISGLVTMEDLVETALGFEIVDESDRVADLREEAKKLRERRLRGLHLIPAEPEDASATEAADEPRTGSAD